MIREENSIKTIDKNNKNEKENFKPTMIAIYSKIQTIFTRHSLKF